jgi:Protein of unknown function (DUF3738)
VGGGQGQGGSDSCGEFRERDGVGGAELGLPLGVGEDLPVFGSDPVDAGHVGRGVEALEFEEFGVALGAGRVGDDAGAVCVEVDEGEHLSADGFVADPEDEVGAPLHGFDSVRKLEEEGAEALGVHGCKGTRYWVRGTGVVRQIYSSGWGFGNVSMGMRFVRGMGFGAVLIVLAATAFGQVPDWQTAAGGTMAFEVASIRLSKPGTFTPPSIPLNAEDQAAPTDGVFFADFQLADYIGFAYKVWLSPEESKALLATLPKWAVTDHFTIRAKAPGHPTKDQMRLMVQSLLAERFKLAIHFEKQQMSVLGADAGEAGEDGA